MTQKVHNICVVNSAGFDLKFDVHTESGGHHTKETEYFLSGQSYTVRPTDDPNGTWYIKDLKSGDKIRPKVFAAAGENKYGDHYVEYEADSSDTATYHVTGTTLDYSVTLK